MDDAQAAHRSRLPGVGIMIHDVYRHVPYICAIKIQPNVARFIIYIYILYVYIDPYGLNFQILGEDQT